MASNSFGSVSNVGYNHSSGVGSPSADPPEHNYRRDSNSSNSEKVGFLNTSGNFTTPRQSLLTSKLKFQKNKPSASSPCEKANDDKSNFPYPNPRNIHAVKGKMSPVVGNANKTEHQPSSLSSSFTQYKIEGANQFHAGHFAYNPPSAVSSSYSSAPVVLGQYNGFISVKDDEELPRSVIGVTGATNAGYSFPGAAPVTATTNISMETASSEISQTGSDSFQDENAIEVEDNEEEETKEIKKSEGLSNNANITNPGNSIANEIYNLNVPCHSGITVDHKGEEHLNIVEYPSLELLLMLASLLQKIIEANDTYHPNHYHRASQMHQTNRYTANVLAFHGKNVPAIPIYNYFLRILKYCPMTNEVFLSLLVYFDRIAKRANINSSSSIASGENLANKDHKAQLFVMDSYNIHRLIIAGIAVSSKFFSDVFYKNTRYARVGGLPLDELNHIEIQFLLLTDFKLMVQPDELQRYADLLLKFWKRERSRDPQSQQIPQPLPSQLPQKQET